MGNIDSFYKRCLIDNKSLFSLDFRPFLWYCVCYHEKEVVHMTRKKQVNNENGAVLNRGFPSRPRERYASRAPDVSIRSMITSGKAASIRACQTASGRSSTSTQKRESNAKPSSPRWLPKRKRRSRRKKQNEKRAPSNGALQNLCQKWQRPLKLIEKCIEIWYNKLTDK